MRRTTPGLLTILGLILALLVACGGGTATFTPSTAPSTLPTIAASAAPSAAPTTAASAAPSGAPTAPVRTTPSATAPTGATATRTGATPGTATRAASPATGGPTPKVTGALTIFAASSLTDAFNEMKAAIEAANPGTSLTFNFAASSALRTQLEQGAKADVFASADTAQLDNAKKSGVAAGDSPLFARNTPVIIVPANNPRGIAALADLAKPGVKLVLAAPEVPIGNYARQVIDKASQDRAYGASFSTATLANVVSNEANVRQVVSKVQLGEGDAGIVYSSDVTPAVRAQVTIIPIPEAVNVIAEYPVALVMGGANPAGAQAFVDYLLAPAGQAVLQKWGFIPVRPATAGSAGAAPAAADAQLTGLVEHPGPLTLAALQQLPAETLQVTYASGTGTQRHTEKGVRLVAVIDQAKLQVDPQKKNDKLRKYLVVTGQDGYEAVIAWGELDPDFGNAAILLSWEEDGKPLGGADGPLRLVVPGDGHGGRYISGVVRIEVRDVDSAPRQ